MVVFQLSSLIQFMKPCLLAGPRSTAALDPMLLLVHRRSSRLLENRIHSGHPFFSTSTLSISVSYNEFGIGGIKEK